MAKPLTDSAISKLGPTRGQVGWREIVDGGSAGLRLRISPKGEKVWALRYVVGGKRERHTLGAYPAVALAEARKRAKEYRAAGRDGVTATEVEARMRALTLTVADAHAEYIAAVGGGLKKRTKTLKEGMFRDHIAPVIGQRFIRSVRRPDITEVVRRVAAKGFTVQSNRVFSEAMAFLRWCEQRDYVDGVPTLKKKDLRAVGAAKERPRRRTLSDGEISEVWTKSGGLDGIAGDYIRLLMLLGQRRDEVRLMWIPHIDFAQSLWTIPAELYKTNIDHAVPLPAEVMEIIARRVGRRKTGYVFAGRKPGMPYNGAASAMRRLRKVMPNRLRFTLHDLRRTCRTTLSRLGVDRETAELVIGHIPDGMEQVYNLYDRLSERRDALERWTRFVVSLGEGSGNVIQFASKGAIGR